MGIIVNPDEVKLFLSTKVVERTYDDNNDGTIDGPSLLLIIDVSEGLFLATIRGLYELPLVAPVDPFAKQVVLQLVHCQSIKRHPEVFRQDSKSVCDDVEMLLKQIRSGDLQLDIPLRDGSTGPVAGSLTPRGYERLEPTPDE